MMNSKFQKQEILMGFVMIAFVIVLRVVLEEDNYQDIFLVSTIVFYISLYLVSLMFRYNKKSIDKKLELLTPELSIDELEILEGHAINISKENNTSGKLLLTNKRVLFLSSDLEMECTQVSYDFNSIYDISLETTLFDLVDIGLRITTKTGVYKFDIDFPADWKKLFEKQLNISFY